MMMMAMTMTMTMTMMKMMMMMMMIIIMIKIIHTILYNTYHSIPMYPMFSLITDANLINME